MNTSTKEIKSKKNPLLLKNLFIAITIIIVFTGICYYVYDNYFLSSEEKLAIDNVLNLKSMLKDPDSFKLYDDVLVVFYWVYPESSVENGYYVYINYGARNSYGGMKREIAMYRHLDFRGSTEEANDIGVPGNDEELLVKKTHLPYLAYLANHSSIMSYKIVSKDKVMRHIR